MPLFNFDDYHRPAPAPKKAEKGPVLLRFTEPDQPTQSTAKKAPAVWLLIVLNVLMYFFVIFMSRTGESDFLERICVVPYILTHNFSLQSVGSVFSSMFVHFNLSHLLGNMWMLSAVGASVELSIGGGFFLALYIASSVVGTLAYVVSEPNSLRMLAGASGGVAGVMGLFFILCPTKRVQLFKGKVKIPGFYLVFLWFLMELFFGFHELHSPVNQPMTVAHWSHVAGFVVGALTGAILRFSNWMPGDDNEEGILMRMQNQGARKISPLWLVIALPVTLWTGLFVCTYLSMGTFRIDAYWNYIQAKAYLASADYQQSIHFADDTIKEVPSFPGAYVIRGTALAQMHHFPQALEDIGKVIEQKPNYALVHFIRAGIYLQQKQYSEALSDLNAEIKLEPSYAALYCVRALVLQKLAREKDASSDYETVASLGCKCTPDQKPKGLLQDKYAAQEQQNPQNVQNYQDWERANGFRPRSSSGFRAPSEHAK